MIRVSSQEQTVRLFHGDAVVWSAPVSTSRFGLGEEAGSQKTPRGLHSICEKIGANVPVFTIFDARLPVGIWDRAPSEKDLILTRILWLDGMEAANRSTKSRFIYFHGTNDETRIGTPASHGCIRLKNDDIISLFERIEIGTQVYIE